jgi:hypothetical protein
VISALDFLSVAPAIAHGITVEIVQRLQLAVVSLDADLKAMGLEFAAKPQGQRLTPRRMARLLQAAGLLETIKQWAMPDFGFWWVRVAYCLGN